MVIPIVQASTLKLIRFNLFRVDEQKKKKQHEYESSLEYDQPTTHIVCSVPCYEESWGISVHFQRLHAQCLPGFPEGK